MRDICGRALATGFADDHTNAAVCCAVVEQPASLETPQTVRHGGGGAEPAVEMAETGPDRLGQTAIPVQQRRPVDQIWMSSQPPSHSKGFQQSLSG
jgi:hypothetical protein